MTNTTNTTVTSQVTENSTLLSIAMPTLPKNTRITKATLNLGQSTQTGSIFAYGYTGDMTAPVLDPYITDYCTISDTDGACILDVTPLAKRASEGVSTGISLCVKNGGDALSQVFITNDEPILSITYETPFDTADTRHTETFNAGKNCNISVDAVCGRLVLECQSVAVPCNRSPVTLSHVYNSAMSGYNYTANSIPSVTCADFSAMKLGYGFRLNIMQSMVLSGENYIFTTDTGKTLVFEKSGEGYDDVTETYYDTYAYTDGDESICYDPFFRTFTLDEQVYTFDVRGRLISIKAKDESTMIITYTNDRIAAVTDGVGRVFYFDYADTNELLRITNPDGTYVSFSYSDNKLSAITYPDGTSEQFGYTGNELTSVTLLDASGNAVKKQEYTYVNNRVSSVTDYGAQNSAFVLGNKKEYSYFPHLNKTEVTLTEPECSPEKTVYALDNDGTFISAYTETSECGLCLNEGDRLVPSITNYLCGTPSFNGRARYADAMYSMYGRAIQIYTTSSESNNCYGASWGTEFVPAGDYTASMFLRVATAFRNATNAGVYLKVTTADGEYESERIKNVTSDFIRVQLPFVNSTTGVIGVSVMSEGKGVAYFSGVQLERGDSANKYNLIEDGKLNYYMTYWNCTDNVSNTNVDTLGGEYNVTISSTPDTEGYAAQQVTVKTDKKSRETFTLSGWGKATALATKDSPFRLKAVITYSDNTTEEHIADFSPKTHAWQYTSVQFAKSEYKAVKHITVYCEYSNNTGSASFTDIQLVRDSYETVLSEEDFWHPAEEDEQTTESVETAVTDFEEVTDAFGNNLTETTFVNGEYGTLYRAYEYSENGNDIISQTDTRGNITRFDVDSDNSHTEEITDRLGNKTAYEYDSLGRTTKVVSKDASGTALCDVSYTYDSVDNLCEIVRGDGMKYSLTYNSFGSLASIGVDGKNTPLVRYTCKQGSGRVKRIDYANGDFVELTYDRLGNVIAERWNGYQPYYKYSYDNEGNLTRSVDFSDEKEYNYTYNNSVLTAAIQYDITVAYDNSDIPYAVSKTQSGYIYYTYDNQGRLIQKNVNGSKYFYDHTEDGRIITRYGDTLISSKDDSFGRREFEELSFKTGILTRRFEYCDGEITDTHKQNGKIKSGAITQLVKRIVLSDGRVLEYEYDKEERITKVSDSLAGVTEYAYDSLGQLICESANGVKTVVTYDNYGNILTKGNNTYTYADSVWRDKLTAYNGQSITYDNQGNPTSYLGHTLVWEKGRQLKSFDTNSYTYNANGIRTSKSVNGVKHTYVLDGTKLLRETWGANTLTPLYDENDEVRGICYNDSYYYFHKNLQGDIIAITDSTGTTVAAYTYDAWGVCTVTSDISQNDIATINPYRYRGYYYDRETSLYYLQSRYYDANIGRFLNADEVVFVFFIDDNNKGSLFSYCENNVVNMIDFNGRKPNQLFKSIDAAAIDFAKEYNVESIKKRREYTSTVLKVTRLELRSYGFSNYLKKYVLCTYYKYTTPKIWFKSSALFWPWEAKKSVALLHTHGAMTEKEINTFSSADKKTANKYNKLMYVATPYGNLLRYDPDNYSIYKFPIKIPIK